MCKFIDGEFCSFRFESILKCLEDAGNWQDFAPGQRRPYTGKVWLGYDPARCGDGSIVVVIAPPMNQGGVYRILEIVNLSGYNWQYQADRVKEVCARYNVEHIGIDTTKQGSGVFEAVRQFFPRAEAIHYNIEIKNALVLQAQSVIHAGRLKWDPVHSEIAQSFMTITNSMSGDRNASFRTKRTKLTGHGDSAWTIMHALKKAPLIEAKVKCRSFR